MPDLVSALAARIVTEADRADANRRGHAVIELALLTLVIDAKLATIEQVVQRIQSIRESLPEPFQAEDVGQRVRWITEWLLSHVDRPRGRWTPQVIEGGLDQSSASDQEPPSQDE